MDDAVGDRVEDIVGDRLDRRGHRVDGVDGADDGEPLLRALAVADADGPHVGDRGEVLPDLAGEAGLGELLAEDRVGLADGLEAVAGDLAEATDAEARAREGLAEDHVLGEAEAEADDADLVLVKELEGLDELEGHALGKAADVVVGLDAVALDDVGVDRPLGEEGDALALAGLFVEDLDELAADDLPLLLRGGDALEETEEAVGRVDVDEVGVELLLEDLDDLLALALAHQAVVDVDADQLFADDLDEEGRDDGGVDAAGEGEEDLLVTDLGANGGDLFVDEGGGQFGGGDPFHVFRAFLCHVKNLQYG